jgi:hypothetical protein
MRVIAFTFTFRRSVARLQADADVLTEKIADVLTNMTGGQLELGDEHQ